MTLMNRLLDGNVYALDVLDDPPLETLRVLARRDERTTIHGSAGYVGSVRHRSADATVTVFEADHGEYGAIVSDVERYLARRRMIRITRQAGVGEPYRMKCETWVPEAYARLAYAWGSMLFEADRETRSGSIVVAVPDWPQRHVLVFPERRVTLVLGSDYIGELKKATLRMVMWNAKTEHDWLGLHAATKVIRVRERSGINETGIVLFGLSGTGKTTLATHGHGLDGDEAAFVRQDDVVIFRSDGSCAGTEDRFYLKTLGLSQTDDPLLFNAASSPHAILENVFIDAFGSIDFSDMTISENGRAIVRRTDLAPRTDDRIDLDRCDVIAFIIRRNDILPPVARLSIEQAAAFFMLGESTITSADDPERAGEAVRVVGMNPFIVGGLAHEGNRFYEMLREIDPPMCILLNTGRIGGQGGEKVTVEDTARLLLDAIRGEIAWETEPHVGSGDGFGRSRSGSVSAGPLLHIYGDRS